MTPTPHDAYFATVPKDVQPRMAAIQAQVELLVPGAKEAICRSR